ncbi:hypothetical protein AMS62_10080 [Bacillus sp. FJAT-18019]|nr:hypothetical protein AMS62_10080 [Bacillus sp. FJAT-18019]
MNKLIELEWRQNKRSFWIAFFLVGILQAIPAIAAKPYLESESLINKSVTQPHQETHLTFEGWVSGQPFTFFLLILGFFAISWSICSIVKDQDRQTTEFLYTMPHSRTSIYFSKWLANIVQVLIIAVISAGIVLLIGKSTTMMNDPWTVCSIMIAGLLITLGFMGIGFALTSWLHSERGALSMGIAVVFIMFLLNMLSDLNDSVKWLENVSLFNLFDVNAISQGAGLPVGNVVVALTLFVLGSIAGWMKLTRKDL